MAIYSADVNKTASQNLTHFRWKCLLRLFIQLFIHFKYLAKMVYELKKQDTLFYIFIIL